MFKVTLNDENKSTIQLELDDWRLQLIEPAEVIAIKTYADTKEHAMAESVTIISTNIYGPEYTWGLTRNIERILEEFKRNYRRKLVIEGFHPFKLNV